MFLFNNCTLPKFDRDFYEGKNVIENFNKMKLFKSTMTFKKMIKAIELHDDNERDYNQNKERIQKMLIEFTKDVDQMSFIDEPDYEKLQSLL